MALVTGTDARLGPQPFHRNFDPIEGNVAITRLEQKLEACRQRLCDAWGKFTAVLPAEERLTVGETPDLAYLLDSIKQATARWDHKRQTTRTGKLQVKFENVMSRINDHRDLLSVVPSDDKYVSAIAGSLAIMAKAAVNHQRIGELVSDLFEGLHDDLDYWKRQMTVHRHNQFMQSHVIELYVVIFEMFTDIFRGWSGAKGWKRLVNSLDNVWLEKAVERRKERIDQLKTSLENEAKLATEQVIHEGRVKMAALEKISTSQNQDIKELKEQISRLVQELQLRPTLSSHNDQRTIDHSPLRAITSGPSSDMSVPSETRELDMTFMSVMTHRPQQVETIELCQPALVSRELKSMFESWLEGNKSSALWIEGPFDIESPSRTTSMCTTLIGVLQSMSSPVISHICTSARPNVNRRDHCRLGLLSLVFDLCQQCWTYREPTRIDASLWEDIVQNYQHLREHPLSVSAALILLETLLKVRKSLWICLIDNFNMLEDPEDTEQTDLMGRLIQVLTLRSGGWQTRGGVGDGPIVKLCLTTDGASSVLGTYAYEGWISRWEYVHGLDADEALNFDNR